MLFNNLLYLRGDGLALYYPQSKPHGQLDEVYSRDLRVCVSIIIGRLELSKPSNLDQSRKQSKHNPMTNCPCSTFDSPNDGKRYTQHDDFLY